MNVIELPLNPSKEKLLEAIDKASKNESYIVVNTSEYKILMHDALDAFARILKNFSEEERDEILKSDSMQNYYRHRLMQLSESSSILDNFVPSSSSQKIG